MKHIQTESDKNQAEELINLWIDGIRGEINRTLRGRGSRAAFIDACKPLCTENTIRSFLRDRTAPGIDKVFSMCYVAGINPSFIINSTTNCKLCPYSEAAKELAKLTKRHEELKKTCRELTQEFHELKDTGRMCVVAEPNYNNRYWCYECPTCGRLIRDYGTAYCCDCGTKILW